jgi:hypothetical protein
MPVAANAVVPDNVAGNERVKNFTYTGPSSYSTGGESITPDTLGFVTITSVSVDGPSGAGVLFRYDYTNQKVQAFWAGAFSTALSEVTNSTNLSTSTVRLKVWGQ